MGNNRENIMEDNIAMPYIKLESVEDKATLHDGSSELPSLTMDCYAFSITFILVTSFISFGFLLILSGPTVDNILIPPHLEIRSPSINIVHVPSDGNYFTSDWNVSVTLNNTNKNFGFDYNFVKAYMNDQQWNRIGVATAHPNVFQGAGNNDTAVVLRFRDNKLPMVDWTNDRTSGLAKMILTMCWNISTRISPERKNYYKDVTHMYTYCNGLVVSFRLNNNNKSKVDILFDSGSCEVMLGGGIMFPYDMCKGNM